MSIEKRLTELGITLPEAPRPLAAAFSRRLQPKIIMEG